MDTSSTIAALGALAQETRLATFRLLVRAEPEGLAAGAIARELEIPHNTMSSHLAALSHAGLIRSRRAGRSVIYRADLEAMRALLTYLLEDCCGGAPELCAPALDHLLAERCP